MIHTLPDSSVVQIRTLEGVVDLLSDILHSPRASEKRLYIRGEVHFCYEQREGETSLRKTDYFLGDLLVERHGKNGFGFWSSDIPFLRDFFLPQKRKMRERFVTSDIDIGSYRKDDAGKKSVPEIRFEQGDSFVSLTLTGRPFLFDVDAPDKYKAIALCEPVYWREVFRAAGVGEGKEIIPALTYQPLSAGRIVSTSWYQFTHTARGSNLFVGWRNGNDQIRVYSRMLLPVIDTQLHVNRSEADFSSFDIPGGRKLYIVSSPFPHRIVNSIRSFLAYIPG